MGFCGRTEPPQRSSRASTPSGFLSALAIHSLIDAASLLATVPMSKVALPSIDYRMSPENVSEDLGTEKVKDKNYAVVTVLFNSISKQDSSELIKAIFNDKMTTPILSTLDFQLLVFLIKFSFHNNTLVSDTNQI
ncbi:hypothetical protein A0J61_01054 [Choanephora cucurbitarum]|uniref:Uncharacterized protein n=1 Tax=Choanephora cucurbitarum TaxID=101091 RepID=A0A1C7NP83_9FUNG|nr:hypothetical protein A0J61_01054 [Choanephora cucurbitarum]